MARKGKAPVPARAEPMVRGLSLERNGLELPVRGRGQSDCRPFGLRLAALGFAGRANSPHDFLLERDGVELLVPCREKMNPVREPEPKLSRR